MLKMSSIDSTLGIHVQTRLHTRTDVLDAGLIIKEHHGLPRDVGEDFFGHTPREGMN